MFQAEYSSGQPLRMLVDLRASVDGALGRGAEAGDSEKAAEATAAAKLAPAKAATAKTTPRAAAAGVSGMSAFAKPISAAAEKPVAKFAASSDDAPEFEISAGSPEWTPDEDSPAGQKK
jgi:hypothetical protein